MKNVLIALVLNLIFMFLCSGCNTGSKTGEEGQKCFDNNSCKGHLWCIDGFCVDILDYPDVDPADSVPDKESNNGEKPDDEAGDEDEIGENGNDNTDLIDECDFSVEVTSKKDLDSIVNCRVITGELIIEETDLEEVVLPHLEKVWDYFDITDNPKLKKISMPKLEYAGSIFAIDFNPVLTEIDLSELSYVYDNILVWGNDSLKTFSLPNFQKADNGVYISFNESLESIDAPMLESIWEFFEIDHNDSLKSVSFPALESALLLFIARNSSLETFDMSSLNDVQEIEIVFNAQLPTEKAEALVDQVLEKRPSLDYTICGNKDGEECDFDWNDLD